MMLVCVNCKIEMLCDKNGVGVRYGHGHVYPGDRYKCPRCKVTVIYTLGTPIYDGTGTSQEEYLDMLPRVPV